MSDGFQFLDIILLAMVAAFVVLRLRSVLGRRTGHQQQRPPAPLPDKREPDNVVALPDRSRSGEAAAEDETAGLTRIRLADRSFDTNEFLAGARAAYEMIVTAFAAADKDMLRPLLNDEVYRNFAQAIDQRRAAGERLETTVVGLKECEIVEADMKGRTAEITVRFVSEVITATYDAEGKVVAGNPGAVNDVTDIWTFARETRSSDPNWLLIATSAPG